MTVEHITIGLVLAFCWLVVLLGVITQLRFVIDEHYVRVKLLGLTLRKIALSDIESVDTKAPLWNEHWCTSLSLKRVVRIRRKSGWFRNFIITPPDRDAFIAELRGRLTGR
jgi:hypothetical protein